MMYFKSTGVQHVPIVDCSKLHGEHFLALEYYRVVKTLLQKGVSRSQVAKCSAPQSHQSYLECGMSTTILHFRPSGLLLEVLRYPD